MKIFVYEMKKILIKQYAIIILAAVVIVRLLSSLPLAKQTYGFDSATEREKYFEIISPFIGAVTEEKTDRADELENQLKTASQQYDKLIDQRLEHKISHWRSCACRTCSTVFSICFLILSVGSYSFICS